MSLTSVFPDSTSAIAGGASELAWNGVSYSDSAIQEGKYTFWAYEQLDYRNNYGTVDANGKKVADLLANQIKNNRRRAGWRTALDHERDPHGRRRPRFQQILIVS